MRRRYGPTYTSRKPVIAGGLAVAVIAALVLAKSRDDSAVGSPAPACGRMPGVGQPDVSAAPDGITVDAVDWLPSGAAQRPRARPRPHRRRRRRPARPGDRPRRPRASVHVAARSARRTSSPQAWRGAYVVGAALVAAAGEHMALEWPIGARLALPGVAADVPRRPAGAGRGGARGRGRGPRRAGRAPGAARRGGRAGAGADRARGAAGGRGARAARERARGAAGGRHACARDEEMAAGARPPAPRRRRASRS